MRRSSKAGRFAERVSTGVDDTGNEERIVIWIERKAGAVWAVGRSVNPQLRQLGRAQPDEYLFEGYELDDALEARERRARGRGQRARAATAARSTRSRSSARSCSARSSAGSSVARLSCLTSFRASSGPRRDRIAVRIVRRIAERLVDALPRAPPRARARAGLPRRARRRRARPSVSARYSSSRRWWRITSSATRSPARVSSTPR